MRNDITRDVVQRLYFDEGMGIAQVCAELRCGYGTLISRMDRWGMARRPRGQDKGAGAGPRPSRETLVEMYVERGMTLTEMRIQLKIGFKRLKQIMIEEGIELRPGRPGAGRRTGIRGVSGAEWLVVRMLERAVDDMRLGNGHRVDAWMFLSSPEAQDLAASVGVDPGAFGERVDRLGVEFGLV